MILSVHLMALKELPTGIIVLTWSVEEQVNFASARECGAGPKNWTGNWMVHRQTEPSDQERQRAMNNGKLTIVPK